jgi:hypothetical protein
VEDFTTKAQRVHKGPQRLTKKAEIKGQKGNKEEQAPRESFFVSFVSLNSVLCLLCVSLCSLCAFVVKSSSIGA